MSGWTSDRIEMLKSLWDQGYSGTQIADELGGVTRNAVIGKVHRLKLPLRDKKAAPRPGPRLTRGQAGVRTQAGHKLVAIVARKRAPPAPLPDVALLPSLVPLAATPDGAVTILQLTAGMCRFPLGDTMARAEFFHGARALPGLPYCAEHMRLCYDPVNSRRGDRYNRGAGYGR
jgi:GcrA cell cycle regulator